MRTKQKAWPLRHWSSQHSSAHIHGECVCVCFVAFCNISFCFQFEFGCFPRGSTNNIWKICPFFMLSSRNASDMNIEHDENWTRRNDVRTRGRRFKTFVHDERSNKRKFHFEINVPSLASIFSCACLSLWRKRTALIVLWSILFVQNHRQTPTVLFPLCRNERQLLYLWTISHFARWTKTISTLINFIWSEFFSLSLFSGYKFYTNNGQLNADEREWPIRVECWQLHFAANSKLFFCSI